MIFKALVAIMLLILGIAEIIDHNRGVARESMTRLAHASATSVDSKSIRKSMREWQPK